MAVNITSTTAMAGFSNDVGISFGGAGFLIFYYLGIVEVLSKLGVITPSTKLAGCSSGAIISTSHCAGVPTATVYKAGQDLAHSCRSQFSCSGILDKALRKVLDDTLPGDAYKRCTNRGFIAISTGQVLLNQHRALIVSDFKDNTDLVDAAASSSFIPLWSGGTMSKQFRGLPVYDGGFAAGQPCPPGVKTCIRISTSNPAWPRRSSVETFMARVAMRGPMAVVTPNPAEKSYPPIMPTGSNGGPDPELVKLAASKGMDIAPGIYHKMPWTQQEWNEAALTPADDGTLHYMFELGKADAAAWVKYTGHALQKQQQPQGSKGRRLAAGSH